MEEPTLSMNIFVDILAFCLTYLSFLYRVAVALELKDHVYISILPCVLLFLLVLLLLLLLWLLLLLLFLCVLFVAAFVVCF